MNKLDKAKLQALKALDDPKTEANRWIAREDLISALVADGHARDDASAAIRELSESECIELRRGFVQNRDSMEMVARIKGRGRERLEELQRAKWYLPTITTLAWMAVAAIVTVVIERMLGG